MTSPEKAPASPSQPKALDIGGTQQKTMSLKETSKSNGRCKLQHMSQNACIHSKNHRV